MWFLWILVDKTFIIHILRTSFATDYQIEILHTFLYVKSQNLMEVVAKSSHTSSHHCFTSRYSPDLYQSIQLPLCTILILYSGSSLNPVPDEREEYRIVLQNSKDTHIYKVIRQTLYIKWFLIQMYEADFWQQKHAGTIKP